MQWRLLGKGSAKIAFGNGTKQLRVHYPNVLSENLRLGLRHQDFRCVIYVCDTELTVHSHESILNVLKYFHRAFESAYRRSRGWLESIKQGKRRQQLRSRIEK